MHFLRIYKKSRSFHQKLIKYLLHFCKYPLLGAGQICDLRRFKANCKNVQMYICTDVRCPSECDQPVLYQTCSEHRFTGF